MRNQGEINSLISLSCYAFQRFNAYRDREALFSIVASRDKFMAAAPFSFVVASWIILIAAQGKASVDALLAARLWGVGLSATSAGRRS